MTKPLTSAQEAKLREQFETLRASLDSAAETTGHTAFYDALVAADAALKQTIPYFAPPHERPVVTSDGDVEFGAIPFWAKNPSQIPYASNIPKILLEGLELLEFAGVIPPPTITQSEYNTLLKAVENGYAVGNDGTLWSTEPFGQLNYRWLEAVINVFLVNQAYKKSPFVATPSTATLSGADEDAIKIALIGDWGTGATDAQSVRDAAMNLYPDYLIHLGDVYYTGTPQWSNLRPFVGMDNEVDNLVNQWPSGLTSGQSYTMNSNHEMYCGAYGLYGDALTAAPFKHQNGCTYFLLENDQFQIFGLDSAYDSPDWLFMDGALNQPQIDFVQGAIDPSKTTIILTHHTPFNLTGTEKVSKEHNGQNVSLWNQMLTATNKKVPNYWYFGHIHDGIAYQEAPNGNFFEGCKARCTGHASMPYGAPWGLAKIGKQAPFSKGDWIDTVEFAAGSPKMDTAPNGQVKNGFMLLTLSSTGVSEAFYDEDGVKTWSSDT